MISADAIRRDNTRAGVFLREKSEPCHCGRKPVNIYEPGCRTIRCEIDGHAEVVDDCDLAEGFRKWNVMRIHAKQLGKDRKK